MSEISKYDAQKKKLDALCEEHDLNFRLRHNQYPITLTITPLTGVENQIDMLADADSKNYISPDAAMVIYRKDGELAIKTTGTFTISEALRNKFKNIYVKLADFYQQYFFRQIMENELLQKSQLPVIDEGEAQDDDDISELEEEDQDDEENSGEDASDDDLFLAACQLVRMENKASVSLLQRRLKIGYSRAGRLMQALEDGGVVGPYKGSEPREVLPADAPAEE